MPKQLASPLVVVAEQTADRLDIVRYTVDARAMTVTMEIQASRQNADGTRTLLDYPDQVRDQEAVKAAMVEAVVSIALAVVNPPTQDARDALAAAVRANPGSWTLYYVATRDALYGIL